MPLALIATRGDDEVSVKVYRATHTQLVMTVGFEYICRARIHGKDDPARDYFTDNEPDAIRIAEDSVTRIKAALRIAARFRGRPVQAQPLPPRRRPR